MVRLLNTRPKHLYGDIFPISAFTGTGCDKLQEAMLGAVHRQNFNFFGTAMHKTY